MRTSIIRSLISGVSFTALASLASAQGIERSTYIVMLNPGAGQPGNIAAELAAQTGGQIGFIYGALGGFSIVLPAPAADALARDPRIAVVAPNGIRRINAQTVPTGVDRVFALDNGALTIDGADDQRVDVDVAIIDTGIDWGHADLNVVAGVDCLTRLSGGKNPVLGCVAGLGQGQDDHGHGTHVAGTVGALDNDIDVVGIAPGARLWAVKACDRRGECPDDRVVAGIDWVVQQGGIEVINMSLGGPTLNPDPYPFAVQSATASGVVVVVAAGNDSDDANLYSPAHVTEAITVSALADFDGSEGGTGNLCITSGAFGYSGPEESLAVFSNYGTAVDIAAPGTCILSTKNGGGTEKMNGTSMASPHVAGAAAVLASAYNDNMSAALVTQITNELIGSGNFNWNGINTASDPKEPLLDVGNDMLFVAATVPGSDGPDTVPPTPVIASTASNPTSLAAIPVTVDFGEDVTGFDATDLDVTNRSASNFAGGGASYSFDLIPSVLTSPITVSVDIAAGTAADLAGNASLSAVTFVRDYTPPPPPGSFQITAATPYKIRGVQTVDLTWSGSSGANLDIRRDGINVTGGTDIADTGAFTDNIGAKGGGNYTYEVCETGTSICTPPVGVSF